MCCRVVELGGLASSVAERLLGARAALREPAVEVDPSILTSSGADRGELKFEGNSEIKVLDNGDFEFKPSKGSGNILFHDRNDRDLERSMQALAENVAAFRVATEFSRGRIELLNAAIRERP